MANYLDENGLAYAWGKIKNELTDIRSSIQHFAFEIKEESDGTAHLYLVYTNSASPPPFSINNEGHLIYTI